MPAWLVLASIATALTSAAGPGAEGQDMIIRAARNGEFIASHYPAGALKRGEQGRVAFRIVLETDGSLGTCDITESSGFARLDQETCEILLRYGRFQPVHNEEGRAVRKAQDGFMVWRLPDGVKVATTDAKTMPKPERIICRRGTRLGSLYAKSKVCMTRSEWDLNDRMTREEIERVQGRIFCGDHGCQ